MLALLLTTLAFAGTTVTATTASGFSWTTLKSADNQIKVASFTHQKIDFDIKCSETQCTFYKGSTKLSAKVAVAQVGKNIKFSVGDNNLDYGFVDGFNVQWAAPTLAKGTTVKLAGLTVGEGN